MTERYPGYDVLAKRRTPSWNPQTQRVIDARLAIDPDAHAFFTDAEWLTLKALCEQIAPQPPERTAPIPIAAMIDEQMASGRSDGFRNAEMPPKGEAWRRGLGALDAEARARHARPFHQLAPAERDGLLSAAQKGVLEHEAWGGMPPAMFFSSRLLPDVIGAYYAHPTAWNEIGYGGPAAPRGYVRMEIGLRDPWEAAEARPGEEARAERENRHVGRT